MPVESQMLNTLAFVVLGALLGGFAAAAIRMPVILGYILAGVVLAAFRSELGVSREDTLAIAEFGVALLLFSVGVEISIRHLDSPVVTIWAPAQMVATTLLGFGLALALGFEPIPSLVAGYGIAMSSTAMAIKLLERRNLVTSAQGSVVLSYALTQDLSLVLGLALLPLAAGTQNAQAAIWRVIIGISVLALSWVLATRIVPWVLRQVARLNSRDLFILGILGICFAAAYGTHALGISMAVGAFLAGLIISESEYSHEAIAEAIPFRELFGSFFFVSVGMLFELQFLAENLTSVLSLTALILLGKALIITILTRMAGWHMRVALSAGLGLAQIGEFTFVLALMAFGLDIIPRELYDLLLAATVLTILLSPLLFALLDPIVGFLSRRLRLRGGSRGALPPAHLRDHVILLGYGRVGRRVLRLLCECDFKAVVVDFDARIAREDKGSASVWSIFGDVSNVEILRRCHPKTAGLAILAVPDPTVASIAANILRKLNPQLPIVARAHTVESARHLESLGNAVAVIAEEETAKAIVEDALTIYGLPRSKADEIVEQAPSSKQHSDV